MKRINTNKEKIIDCTHVLDNSSPVYPNDTPLHIKYLKSMESDGYTLSEVITSMHVGTHVDAFSHLTSQSTTMDVFKIEQGISEGCVFNVVGQSVIELSQKQ